MADSAISALTVLLSKEGDPVRKTAIQDLARIGSNGAKALLHAAGALDEESRMGAAQALVFCGHSTIEMLVSFSRSPHWKIRHCAAMALGYLVSGSEDLFHGGSKARFRLPAEPSLRLVVFESLLDRLNDAEERVRVSAAWGIARAKHPAAVPCLLNLLQDPNSTVRKSAAESLGEIGDPRSANFLVQTLSDECARGTKCRCRSLGRDQGTDSCQGFGRSITGS